jgi:hypothetical protein
MFESHPLAGAYVVWVPVAGWSPDSALDDGLQMMHSQCRSFGQWSDEGAHFTGVVRGCGRKSMRPSRIIPGFKTAL